MTEHQAAAEPSRPLRPVVIHYHLFKNAGTSVDSTLKANFGATWTSIEREPILTPAALRQFLSQRPWVSVVSSHTAQLPPPRLPGTEFIPVLFLRHPLDRVRSIYDFERRQQLDAPAPNKAKEVDLAGYVEWRLRRAEENGDHSIANFQVQRLAPSGSGGHGLARAIAAANALEFVGLVEAYEDSIGRLQEVLSARFPRVELRSERANATPGRAQSMAERLERLEHDLGTETFERLRQANTADLALWTHVRGSYPG